ncbi:MULTISPECIES: O-antigen ligase domain-containing protein [unclassified Ruegeria]|uniref:O-antigen ligase domain-containing protein n=1 Tax=unclassified Ruegeria TaxID=2625375 RepID=UPI001487DA17|nr:MULTISPECIES: O-antigen ligase domain-containing protein [unclassified Ruegeria]
MTRVAPQTPAEKIVWCTLIWTWPFYGLGALYVVGPVLGWMLATIAGVSLYLGPVIRLDMRATGPVPALVWIWSVGMLVMLVSLWAGHADWNLGTTKTIKSSIGWAKGWALIPLFILAGAVLPIRREVLVRGQCVVGLWTLCLLPLLIAAPYAGLPHLLFTSPLKAVGGPGPEYFSVYLYTIDPASGTPRWQFFAPWSPFAALLGVCMVLFALEEKHGSWKVIGLAAGVLMILMSKSRMGMVGLVICSLSPRLLPIVARSLGWILLSAVTTTVAVWGAVFVEFGNRALYRFKSARADSTRVRETLQRIAYERWQSDAMVFGHGTVRPGAHLVEYMPIGSHHTWYGLLFVKGLTGFAAFLVPFLGHLAIVTLDAIRSERGRLPLGLLLTVLLLTFGENVEIQTYLLWPTLLMLGLHLREVKSVCLGS